MLIACAEGKFFNFLVIINDGDISIAIMKHAV